MFRGYNPYIGGLKPSFFMVLGSKGFFNNLARLGELGLGRVECVGKVMSKRAA